MKFGLDMRRKGEEGKIDGREDLHEIDFTSG